MARRIAMILTIGGLALALPACGGKGTVAGSGGSSGSAGASGSGGSGACAAAGESCTDLACCNGLLCCGPPVSYPDSGSYGTCMATTGCPVSDRNLKQGFEAVDANQVLDRVGELPISSWSYKSEDPSIRHIGPMAQDFKASFGLGASDRTILQVDGDGVALTAIKALRERLIRLEQRNAELEREIQALKSNKSPRR